MSNVKAVRKYLPDLLVIVFLSLTLPLFFYKLGQSSLVSWDEAWYAQIAKNILTSGNIFNLWWNDMAYYDHPPAGFWLIAIGEAIFGFNEFGARVASAVSGFVCLIAVYFLGKELFNKAVGFASALALCSAVWFLFRARSGNLDIFLTMFFVLTLFFALKGAKDSRYLLPFSISFGLLVLTKTIVPFTIIPALVIVFWRSKIRREEWFLPAVVFFIIVGSWAFSQRLINQDFLKRYLNIGLPGVSVKTSYIDNFLLIKEYLHGGIGKWFWPGVLGVIGGLLTLQKRFYVLSVLFISFFVPFIFSAKGHIWHLIPLYPFMIVSFFGILGWFIQKMLGQLSRLGWLNKPGLLRFLPEVFVVLFSLYISYFQIKQLWYQFIDIPRYVSDEQILSGLAGKYPERFFIDGDFGPTAVFYSGKTVSRITDDGFAGIFDPKDPGYQETFVLITEQYRLDHFKIPKTSYQILRRDRDKILVRKIQ